MTLAPDAAPSEAGIDTRAEPQSRRRLLAMIALPVLVLAGLGWAAFAPIEPGLREALFEIPQGTWARRMAGEKVPIWPDTIRLTLGINDMLVLRNADDVPQQFGPTIIMPGQSFRLPFALASTYSFVCSAHASGQLNIIVEPPPARGWETLRWRWHRLTDDILGASHDHSAGA